MVVGGAELVTRSRLGGVRSRCGDPSADARPAAGTRGKGGRFYPAMYAARSIPLGVLVAVVVWLDPAQSSTVLVLAAAAAAQLGDMLIGVVHRVPGMVVIPLAAAVLHLAGATYLL